MSLHVWIVTHNVVRGDGQGRVNYEIARRLVEGGHRVTIVADQIESDLASVVRVVRVSKGKVRANLINGQVFAARATELLRQQVRPSDLVHTNGFVTWAKSDVNTAHFVHASWAASEHHSLRHRGGARSIYQFAYNRCNAVAERRAFRQAQIVVAVSEIVRQELVRHVGLTSETIRVIPNGVDPNEFCPRSVARAPLGLPSDQRLVLFVGDLRSGVKNLDVILRALPNVPSAHLVVVGDLRSSPYPVMAARLGLASRVHFLGYRRDVAALMRAVDVFAAPSHYDPFGLVVLEAMASGLPVLVSPACGASQLVVNGTTGFVLRDQSSASEVARGLSWLMEHPSEARRMGTAGRVVAQEHTWTAMADQYLNVYQEAAAVRRLGLGDGPPLSSRREKALSG